MDPRSRARQEQPEPIGPATPNGRPVGRAQPATPRPGDGAGSPQSQANSRPGLPVPASMLAVLLLAGGAITVLLVWMLVGRQAPSAEQAPPAAPSAVVPTPPMPASPSPATPSPAVPTPTAAAVILGALPVGDPLEVEVTAAYREYLRVYADALYTLDPSGLPAVAADEELRRVVARIESLKQQGEAIQVNVDHMTRVVRVSGVDAEFGLQDHFVDRSFAIDSVTKQPIEAEDGSSSTDVQLAKGTEEDVLYLFRRLDGTWKIVRSFRVAP
jgi:hypothetical protein